MNDRKILPDLKATAEITSSKKRVKNVYEYLCINPVQYTKPAKLNRFGTKVPVPK